MNRNPDREPQGNEPRRRHRAIVWALIALASLLLLLDTRELDSDRAARHRRGDGDHGRDVTNQDVQEQLSIYLVDQVYATVDVQGQLEERLPPPAQPLAAPIGVAVRGLATDVAERALADPRVQNLVTTAVERAHGQFVALVEDESA